MSKSEVTLVIGDDANAVLEFLEERIRSLGDPGMAELNLARLDGRSSSEEDILTAASAAPFLAEKRLVILSNPLAKAATDEGRRRLLSLLQGLPPTVELILILEDSQKYKDQSKKWSTFHENHWLRKKCNELQINTLIVEKPLPSPAEMPGWIRSKARELGGDLSPAAAAALANHLDNNTRLAALEIEKLLLYVNFERKVEPQDVDRLTANTSQASIFDMVDALASGNAPSAMRLFHRLLEDEEESRLFAMIIRQFRFLLLTREILDEGFGLEAVIRELKIHKYPAQKMVDQARRFTIGRLEELYKRLLMIDEGIKTSQVTLPLAFELLATEVAQP